MRTIDAGREVKAIDLNKIQLGDLKLEVGGDYYLVVDPYTLFDQMLTFTRDGKDILSNDAIFAHPVCYADGTAPAVAIKNINTYCYHDRTILHFRINTKSAVFGRDYKRMSDEAAFAVSKGFVSDMPKPEKNNIFGFEKAEKYLEIDFEATRYTTNPSLRRIKCIEGGSVASQFITNSQRDARNRNMEGVANNISDLIECEAHNETRNAEPETTNNVNSTGFVDAGSVSNNTVTKNDTAQGSEAPTVNKAATAVRNNREQKHKNRNKFTNGTTNTTPNAVKSTSMSPEDLLKLSQN